MSSGHAFVIQKDNIVLILYLDDSWWKMLRPAIFEIIKIIENTNFVKLYNQMMKDNPTERSLRSCRKVLSFPWIAKKPDTQ